MARSKSPLRRLPDWYVGLSIAFVLLAGPAATLVSVELDSAAVESGAGVHSLAFGLPLAWASQDQAAYDPRVGTSADFASPQEVPTHVAALRLAADVAVWCTAAALLFLAAGRLLWRRHEPAAGAATAL
jgi:hypothetical protein